MGNNQDKQTNDQDDEIQDEQDNNEKIIEKKKKSTKKKQKFTVEESAKYFLTLAPADSCDNKSDTTIESFRFWSTFDSGNLHKVVRSEDKPQSFKVWLGSDCSGRSPPLRNNTNVRQWFYFKVHNMLKEPTTCQISIENLEPKQFAKIWKQDREIFYKIQGQKWQRQPIISVEVENKTILKVVFQLALPADTIISVAQCQPWSYKHNQKYIDKMQKQALSQDLYFHREVICNSFEGRAIELLTVTSKTKQCEEQEDIYGDQTIIFPGSSQTSRPTKFDKRYLFLSCRVHAAEAPASYIMKGVLDYLCDGNIDSKAFLDNFVLILIPMLNPDGVYRGHYRFDALGYDLNRVYNRLYKKSKFSGQYSVLETAKYYGPRVNAYIDLHSHSQISNSFVFANKNPCIDTQTEILLLPQLLSYYLDHFSLDPKSIFSKSKNKRIEEFEGQYTENQSLNPEELCWHSTKLQLKEDTKVNKEKQSEPANQQEEEEKNQSVPKVKKVKQAFQYVEGFSGIGKQDVYYSSSINFCYTLETNYRYYFVKQGTEQLKKKFNQEHFCNIGEAIILCMLEMSELRESRSIIPKQEGLKNLQDLRGKIKEKLQAFNP